MADENFILYLGENHSTMESFSIFTIVKKTGGDSKSDLYELNARDVPIKLSFVDWVKSWFSKDEFHPACKLRSALISKDKMFPKRGTNPMVTFVLPESFDELIPAFRDDPLWGTCFEMGYKAKDEALKYRLALQAGERLEGETLNMITQSLEKDQEQFNRKIKTYLEVQATGKPQVPPQPNNVQNNPRLGYME